MSAPRIAVLLLNMGGPASLEAVEPFLYNLFADPDLIPLPLGFAWQRLFARLLSRSRSQTVGDYYRKIGGRSPLGEITEGQAKRLEARLSASGERRVRCYVAMRYTPPFTEEAIAEVARDGADILVALSLYPHYTTATSGSSLWAVRAALAAARGLGAVDYLEIDRWPEEPAYLDALALQVARGLEQFPEEVRSGVELLFSAHGLPESFIKKGDPYVRDLEATIGGVLGRLGGQRPWRLSYQSRVGPARWLEPSTDDVLHLLAKTGRQKVLAIPISFVSDHIETLYEIDLLYGDLARSLGLDLRRAPSLNLEPGFIEALAGLVERRISPLLPACQDAKASNFGHLSVI